ncbi:helix-turn-helix domain-containing protein [Methanolobus sp. WCC4]|uniref:TrmB family transcriptional regulator n=1 Tax=Methanolobus sp. WCC4 TaxID=3125784 RepID=UPI0030F805D8
MWEADTISILFISLQNLGFTSYEAKVYAALVKNESATVSTLHLDSGVPNSAIYGTLKKLEKRGIIEFQNTKPMRYRCLPPEEAIAKLKTNYEGECAAVLSELKGMYGVSTGERNEGPVWTIKGVRNVTDKVIQMARGAKKDILVMSSSTPFRILAEQYPSLKKDYATITGIFNKKINDECVSVRFISSDEEEARRLCDLVPLASVKVNSARDTCMDLKSFVIVVDGSEIIVEILKEEDGETDLTAVWASAGEFSQTISHLLNAKWETSENYDRS